MQSYGQRITIVLVSIVLISNSKSMPRTADVLQSVAAGLETLQTERCNCFRIAIHAEALRSNKIRFM